MHTVKFFKNAFNGTMSVNKNEDSREMFVLFISESGGISVQIE